MPFGLYRPTDIQTALNAKENLIGYIPSNLANLEVVALDTSLIKYPCNNVVKTAVDGKLDLPTGTPDGTKFLRDDNSWQPIPAASVAWGAITGTLSSQIDLQTALNAKVDSVSASSPLASSGGVTPTISITQASGSTNGYLSSTDWNTFNNKGSGTVTSITASSPLTGGTITSSGSIGISDAKADSLTKGAATFKDTDFNDDGAGLISIDYTNGQSATSITKGFLTSADWSTFNGKQDLLVSGTNIKTINSTSLLGSGNIAIVGLTDGDKGSITVSGSGTTWTIDPRAVTYPMLPALSASYRLLGRGDDVGSGDVEEITLGSGITMSGTSLELQLKTVNNQIVRGSGNIATPYTLSVQALTSAPVDAQTVYFGNLPKAPVTTAGISKVHIPRAGTIKIARIYTYSGTAGTAEAWSLYIRLNNTTDTLIQTVAISANERTWVNSALSISVVAGDYIEIKGIQPTWATNPNTTIYGGYIFIE